MILIIPLPTLIHLGARLKTYFAYVLLFVLAFRPVYNIGYVAYYELNIDYIVENYCINKEKPQLQCNGKCHLAAQLAVVSIPDSKDDSSLFNTFYEAFVPVYFQDTCFDIALEAIRMLNANNWNYSNCFSEVFRDLSIPPPKTIL